MNEVSSKHVQCILSIKTYLKIREFATLQGYSLDKAVTLAIENFIEDREVSKNVSEKVK